MAALRYLCLSDLHLGASDSLLTHITDEGHADCSVPAAVLKTLCAGLRDMAQRLGDGTPVTLILLGDALDMGLSHTHNTVSAFERFLDALFPPGAPEVFSKDILFVPGNHDNSLWDGARHHAYLEAIKAGKMPRRELAATPMLGTPTMLAPLMTGVLRNRPQLASGSVYVAYPNIGFHNGDKTIVLHHGHYIDAMYRPISRLKQWLDKTSSPPGTVGELAENGPWIGFLWSNLGEAGNDSSTAMSLYEAMLDAGAAHTLSSVLSDRFCGVLESNFGVLPDDQLVHSVTVGELVRGLIDLTIGRAAESQRTGYENVLDSQELVDLRWYLGGPVKAQLRQEGVTDLGQTAFVFGHTHKPFQDQLSVASFDRPVAVYNTGGWVLDQPTLMPSQGGATILIDADLNIASLRLFNDPVNGQMAPVQIGGVAVTLDDRNPLIAAATAAVAANSSGWAAFTANMHAAITRRVGIRMRTLVADIEGDY